MTTLERATRIVDAYWEAVLSELPADLDLFDVHTHLGTDIDGSIGDRDELIAMQRRARITRSFVFCLDEPDRQPAFTAANDRTIQHAATSPNELIPFVRLDLADRPLEEAHRCLDAGARGIKLHPRAQAFLPDDPRLEPVFALAAERDVPILIHGGRGLPPIADMLGTLLDRHNPTLIIAHAGMVDLAAMARNFAARPGVFFDTSVWSPLDLLDLYRLMAPEQVVYASDYPYGRQPSSLFMALRTAKAAGYDEQQMRALFGGTAALIAAGERPETLSAPVGREAYEQPITFARIHQYLSMAATLLWTRQPDTLGLLGLALNACDERSNGHREETEQVRELIAATVDLWKQVSAIEDAHERVQTTRAAFRLLHIATVLTVTSTS